MVKSIARSLERVRERIARACEDASRNPRDISIVAVTKGFDASAIDAALSAGLRDIGENYVQEASEKFSLVRWPSDARKHFIGRVQRNKARRIAALFDVVQTVHGLDVAEILDLSAGHGSKLLDVLIQVNVASDVRQGVEPEAVDALARGLTAFANLRVCGLMTVGPLERAQRPAAFSEAAEVFVSLREQIAQATILSMGMSDDLELAIANGSTMVRLGTALFGDRPGA